MERKVCLQLPTGFQILETDVEMSVWEAEGILLTDKIRRYVRAVRNGERATLYARYLECPHCGKRTPANSMSPLFMVGDARDHRPSKPIVRQWANMQMSLFPDEKRKELHIAHPVTPKGGYTCPECGKDSLKSKVKRQVEISVRKKKVQLRCEIVEMGELLALAWPRNKGMHLHFPLFECLTFDLHRGAVYVRIEDAEGNVLARRDVTENAALLRGGAVDKVMRTSRRVMRLLIFRFREIWGTELPYLGVHIDRSALFRMTRFVGYPPAFYHCIPYERGTDTLDKSFRNIGKKLHFSGNLPEIYEKSGLPNIKSVRRVLFENPGLFFYTEEILGLWNLLKDPNHLCQILSFEGRFRILSDLHIGPGIFTFLRDYKEVRGAVVLKNEMEHGWDSLQSQAVHYSVMCETMRRQVRKEWTENEEGTYPLMLHQSPYSLPVECPDEMLPECCLEGYQFRWLRSSNDQVAVGRQMQNCLVNWHGSHVMAVKKDGAYVAAIEIAGMTVLQARGIKNSSLEEDPELLRVFEVWLKKYQLEKDETCDYDLPY